MAAKVNVKFVIGLSAAVILLFAVVAYVGYSTVSKSAGDHAAEAETAEKGGDFEKAAASWSRAVNKNRTNPEFLKRWFEALAKTTPEGSERYRTQYRQGYELALRGWAEAAPADPVVQRKLLDLILNASRMQAGNIAAWENLRDQAGRVLSAMPQGTPGREQLRRYSGIAMTYRLTIAADPTDTDLAKAEEELKAALQADPNDALTAATYVDWFRVNIVRERARGDTGAANQFVERTREFINNYLATASVKSPVLLNQIQFELQELVNKGDRTLTVEQAFAAQHERIGQMLNQMLSEPVESMDRQLAWSAVKLAIGAQHPEAGAKAEAIFERLLKHDPKDVMTLFTRGEIESALGQNEKAIATYEQIATMPNLPLSPSGLILFDLRPESRARQADAALSMWQRSQGDQAAAEKWLAETQKYYKQYVDTAGPTTSRGSLIQAKLKFAEGDLIESRRLLARYLDEMNPPRSDMGALKLLAEVLRRQGSLGGAREQLEQVLKLNPNDVDALANLADIESQLNNIDAAEQRVQRLLAINPSNERAKSRLEEIRQVRAGEKSTDPVIRILSQIGALMAKTPPDFDGAKKLTREAAETMEPTPRLARALANRLVMFEDVEGAKKLIEKALAKTPDDVGLKADMQALTAGNTMEARLAAVDAAAIPDVIKAMMKFQMYNAVGDQAKADEQFKAAQALDKEHPLVVGVLFDKALLANNAAEARRLSDLASSKNLDRVNGLIFRTRLALFENRLRDAAALAQQAVDADPLNPVGWRLLGGVRMQMGQFVEGISAFEKAVSIRPNDMESVKGLIRAQINAGQPERALITAREALPLSGNDEDLADMWLTLEGEVEGGDRNRAIEIRLRQAQRVPGDLTNQTELAQLLIRVERWAEARASLDALKASRPDLTTAQLEALWFYGQGQVEKAVQTIQAFMDGLPADQKGLEMAVAHARFLARINLLDAGLEVLRKARDSQTKEGMEIDREIGDLAFASGRFQESVDAYTAALTSVKQDDGSRLALRIIEARNKLGQFKEAEEAAAKLGTTGDARQQQAILLLRAEAAEGMGDRARAADLLNRAVAADTTSDLGYFKRAIFLAGDESTRRDAVADLDQALRIRPDFFQARIAQADLLLAQRDEERAISLLREGLNRSPRNGAIRERLYNALVSTGRPAEAETLLADARAKYPEPRWFVLSAALAERLGKFDEAVSLYGQAWETVRNTDIAIRYADGLLRLNPPNLAKAKEVLADPAAQTDKVFPLLLTRARLAAFERRGADLSKDVQAAFALVNQTNADELQLFFQSLRGMLPPQDVFRVVEAIKPAEGFSPLATVQVIRLKLADSGKRTEGLRDLDLLLADTKDPERVQAAVRTVGDLLYFERQYADAVEVYSRLKSVRPTDAQLQNNLAYTLSKHLNRHDEALPLAEAAVAADSGSPNTLDTLGSIQLAVGRLTEAEATLTKALTVAAQPREQVPVLLHLSEVKLAQGDRQKAEDFFEQAERVIVRDPRIRTLFESEVKRVEDKLRQR
jgi:tetratricopeptide (TPR) repeat protein